MLDRSAYVVLLTATRCMLPCRRLQRWAASLGPWVSRDNALVAANSARGARMWVLSCAVAQCLGFICWGFSTQPKMSSFFFFAWGAAPRCCELDLPLVH